MKELGIDEDVQFTNILLEEFLVGRKSNLSQVDATNIKKIEELLKIRDPKFPISKTFLEFSRQKCRDLFIHISYKDKTLAWSDLIPDNEYELGPYLYNTDYGMCCFLAPHVNMKRFSKWSKSWAELYHHINAEAHNGDYNGLHILLDTEQFNYAYHDADGPGFKISLHDHRDKPMIQFSSQLINIGTITQVNKILHNISTLLK